jgi:hypothetical protein
MLQNNKQQTLFTVNVKSKKLSEITNQTPTQIKIYNTIMDQNKIINTVIVEIQKIYDIKLDKNAIITNISKNGNIGTFTIYFN